MEINKFKCIKCNQYKLSNEFRKNFIQRSNYTCGECDNARRRKGRARPKEMQIIEDGVIKYYCSCCKLYHLKEDIYLGKSSLEKRDLRCKKCSKERAKLYHKNNMEKILLANAKKRSSERNLEFDIELSDIVIPKFCPLLEIPIIKGSTMFNRDSSPSLDRIDSSKGYIKGNVRVISNLANSVKRDLDKDLLFKFSKNIINYMT